MFKKFICHFNGHDNQEIDRKGYVKKMHCDRCGKDSYYNIEEENEEFSLISV